MHEENPRRQSAESNPARDEEREAAAAGETADPEAPSEGLLTLICLRCGKEYFFEDGQAPEQLVCEKCGNTVFRSFFSPDPADEVSRDFAESTGRDLDPDDPATDVAPGDVIDLNPD